MASDLKGKAVLITGASTGIGAAAARAFAAHGARLAIHYNASREAAEQVAADVRALGGEAVLVAGDVTESLPTSSASSTRPTSRSVASTC